MPKRQKKLYRRPKKIYDKALIDEENKLINKYGLKSRREVWKADFNISKIRGIAKELITADEKKKEDFVKRQKEKGFEVDNVTDVLALNKENYLERRLQSIVAKKMNATPKQARQLITHKHVKVGNNKMDSPSHLTTRNEEKSIEINIALPMKKIISDEEKNILKQINQKKEAD